MDIVIDGYNLLGSRGGLRGDLAAKRDALIADLARYARVRHHAVTVVFDGAETASLAPVSPVAGVRVVFSQGERADDVVIRLAAGLGDRGTIVSSDREVREKSRRYGGVILGVSEFERRLTGALVDAPSDGADADRDEADEASHGPMKKGNPFRPSKAVRRKRKRLERL